MAACTTQTRLLRRTRAFGYLVSGFVSCWKNWSSKSGKCTDWIGNTITVRPHLGFSVVWIEIRQYKAAELLAHKEILSLRKGLVDVKEVLHVAGVLGWACGLFPWLASSFNSALWGATINTVNPKLLFASQLRVKGRLTWSLLHASKVRYAGSGHR